MDPDEPAPGLDEAREIHLLGAIEQLAGGMEKDDRRVVAERIFGQVPGILGGVDDKPVVGGQLENGGLALGNRFVPVAGGPGEKQHPVRG